MDNTPGQGCLTGLIKLFLLDKIYHWLQRTVGFKQGGCLGCGCGTILFFLFVVFLISILTGTNWFEIGF